MGAGKSTLARLILEALGVDRPSEGSPTFALAHEYGTAGGMAVSHADLYRLKTELELEETGLMEQFWDPGRLVLVEWMDQFPDTMAALQGSGLPILAIRLEFTEAGAGFRRITLMRSD
jgi:tRNA threonylcarbamoyl adenosine modification protein YjeE